MTWLECVGGGIGCVKDGNLLIVVPQTVDRPLTLYGNMPDCPPNHILHITDRGIIVGSYNTATTWRTFYPCKIFSV